MTVARDSVSEQHKLPVNLIMTSLIILTDLQINLEIRDETI